MARTSAVGYIAAKRQTAFNTPVTPDRFFRFLSAPKASAELTNNRYREGGGGRDITLSLKEGIKHSMEFPVFARPTIMGFLLSAGTGPGAVGGAAGGGTMSNGLVGVPKLKTASTCSAFLANNVAAGTATSITTTTSTTAFSTQKICIGWGPNLEFTTCTAGSTTSFTPTAGLLFPHVAGEPVYEVSGFAKVATSAIAPAATGFTLDSGTSGLVSADKLAIGFNTTAGALGSEFGNAECFTSSTIAGTAVSALTPAARNGHSIGAWVYAYDDTGFSTSAVHGFEPISALTGSLDYYTLERLVTGSNAANSIIERLQDCKLGTMELSGESPGPLRLQAGWTGRYAQTMTSTLTENYTNQSSTDLPFRMPNGKFFINFGAQSGISTKLRQFTWNFSNTMATDIYTNAITTDDVLDMARESNFSAQFYFESSAEYYEIFYGGAAAKSAPTTNITAGPVMMDFTIDGTAAAGKRMSIFFPSMTWEAFPTEIDPEPKPIIVEATGVPLKQPGQPLYSIAVQSADLTIY